LSDFRIPVLLLVLDVVGSIMAILGILGAVGLDIGLPVLATIWPFLVVLGFGLMAPMIWWVIKLARSKR